MMVSDVGRTISGSSSFCAAGVGHDRDFRREAFDVLGFLLKKALRDEQRESKRSDARSP